MQRIFTYWKIYRITRNFFLYLALGIIILIVSLFLLLKIPSVQNWASQRTMSWLSKKLETTVSVGKVDVNLLSHVILEDIYIQDHSGDTLLFAGHFEVNIGNINPFKPSIKLKSISISDANLNIRRTLPDSTYNYAFLSDAFSTGPKEEDEIDSLDNTPATFDISLNRINLDNLHIKMHDEVSYSNYDIYDYHAEILINRIDISDRIIALEKVEFDKAEFKFTSLLDTTEDIKEDSYDTIHIALGDWKLETTKIVFNQCAIYYLNENAESHPSGIDFNDLAATDINIRMYDLYYAGDTMVVNINQVSMKEKSGFVLDTLKADVLFSPYEITLNNLWIATPHSSIKEKFAMTFTTLNDFDRYESDVRFNAGFVKSKISAIDINYFSGGLDGIDDVIDLTANVSGSMDNLKLRDLNASIEATAGLKGTVNVRGLPDLDETFVDVKTEPLYVNFNEIEKIIGPGKLPEEIKNLGEVSYIGNITGFVYNLVATGNFVTSQGSVQTDLNFVYDKDTKNSQFTGKFNTTDFNIGVLAGEPELLGRITMDANVDGGIIDSKPEIKMHADVSKVTFNDYTYSNITINGELIDKSFEGDFSVDDPNLVMNFNGLVDFSDTLPDYDFTANFRGKLKPLNLYSEDITVAGRARMNASGKTIDDITGYAGFGDLFVIKGKDIYHLDTLAITSSYEGGNKIFAAQSELIDFKFEGQFTTSLLPTTFKRLITYYTTGTDSVAVADQKATFSIKIKNADKLFSIFYPDVKYIHNVDITGNLNSVGNEFNARMRVQQLGYQTMKFDTILFEARTVSNSLEFFTKVSRSTVGTIKLPTASIDGTFSNNNLAYTFKLGADTDSNRMDLHGVVQFEDTLIAFNILPSEILYKNEKWDILENNTLKFSKNNLYAENFTLTSGDQMISLSSIPDSTYKQILRVKVENIPVHDIFEAFILPGENVTGTLTGNVAIGNIFTDPSFVGVAQINDLAIDGRMYGKLKLQTVRIMPGNRIKITAGLSGEYGFTAEGFYTPASGGNPDDLTTEIKFTKTPISLAEPFMRGILSDMYGDINGTLKISGPTDALAMEGSLNVSKASMRIEYIGTTYKFDNLNVEIDRNKIVVPPQQIKDNANNKGTIEASINYGDNFNSWDFKKLSIVSNRIELLNVDRKDNPDFWGHITGEVSANITGGLDNLLITVNATPAEGTFILPTYGSGNVRRHDFIRFVDRMNPDTMENEINLSIVDVDLVVNVTPAIETKILINSEETEFITGKGYGTLHVEANTLGTVKMDGMLTISEGNYDFSFQGLFQRTFALRSGGTIKFHGDPFKADFDLTAVSRIYNVDVSSLTGTSTTEKMNVDVLISITGTLESPIIDFDIQVAENAAVGSDIEQSLSQIRSDKNELNKQVFGLLITKNFLPQDLTTYNPVGTTVNNTVNDFVASQLSYYFESVLNDFLKNTDVDVGIRNLQEGNYIYNSSQGQQFDISIKQELSKNLIVKVGTTYSDLGTSASNLAGDFEIEYIITSDGRVRVKAFRVSEYDAIVAKNDVKTGVGIYYTKDFDKLKELFQGKKKAGS